jgi:hypothetical protein
MVFGQEKLIPDKHLNDFLNCLGYGWDCGWSAKKIAEEMGFESLGLKPYHVYYFAKKYRDSHGFTPRGKTKKDEPPANTIPYDENMPPNVAEYLRSQGLLVE